MTGLGTLINTGAIIAGGLAGILLKNIFSERMQDTVTKATGLCVVFIGIGGAMEKMLAVSGQSLESGKSMMIILSFVFGSLVGELLNIELRIEQFGSWLKRKTGNEGDAGFLDAFVTASFTVCIGAMAVVGAIQDGLTGDYTLLLAKAILDFIIILIMASSMGKGCIFSAIPVALFQGSITILARFIQPLLTPQAIEYLSLTGSILIFCVGVNLIWKNTFKIANMLPTIIAAAALSYFL